MTCDEHPSQPLREDVRSPIDLRLMSDAREWEQSAMHKRTHQAVHELRHKRHAATLHSQVRELIEPGGCYLVCDHFAGEGGMRSEELYMTAEEQRQALLDGGFASVRQLMLTGGMVLHHAS